MSYTKIALSDETFDRLQQCKLSKGETMDALINRLINKYKVVGEHD